MEIISVRKRTEAHAAGLRQGDKVLSVNGYPAVDFLDFLFFNGEEITLSVEGKGDLSFYYENGDLGFEEFRIRPCNNDCTFCFVSQLPKGLRPSLYLKDDDYRLSFLHGAYITLTNLQEEDFERIQRLHLSPLYVSVQAVTPEVRAHLMRCRHDFDFARAFDRLMASGIRMHTQIVVVPGVNDGRELEKTLDFLMERAQALLSITLVPVGLTGHRQGLAPVRPFTKDEAREVLRIMGEKEKSLSRKGEMPLLWATDEFALIAGHPFSPYYREDLLDNGVGLHAHFKEEFQAILPRAKRRDKQRTAVLTGVDGARILEDFTRALAQKGMSRDLIPVENTLLGPHVTVTGLLSGEDIVRAADKVAADYDKILVPDIIFNEDGLTLDGWPKKAILKYKKKIKIVSATAKGLIDA